MTFTAYTYGCNDINISILQSRSAWNLIFFSESKKKKTVTGKTYTYSFYFIKLLTELSFGFYEQSLSKNYFFQYRYKIGF